MAQKKVDQTKVEEVKGDEGAFVIDDKGQTKWSPNPKPRAKNNFDNKKAKVPKQEDQTPKQPAQFGSKDSELPKCWALESFMHRSLPESQYELFKIEVNGVSVK